MLTTGIYIATTRHSNGIDIVDDCDKLKRLHGQKQAAAETDGTVCKNDLYKVEPDEWGMAVAVGHPAFTSTRQTQPTNVGVMLAGDNYDIDLHRHLRKHRSGRTVGMHNAKASRWNDCGVGADTKSRCLDYRNADIV